MTGIIFLVFLTFNDFNVFGATLRGQNESEPTPVVFWHGMGSESYSSGIVNLMNHLNVTFPGIYVTSIKLEYLPILEQISSYTVHPNTQIKMACDLITKDTRLSDGFNAVGLSQGGQFLRGLLQKCPGVKIKNLITLGAQHQGVYGLPMCLGVSGNLCDQFRELLNHFAYNKFLQEVFTQSTFWHDPLHELIYKTESTFLADLNNEIAINQTYVEMLQSLEKFVMVKFAGDTMVQPIESSWFGFYEPGQSEEILSLQETSLYKNDRLGLRKMEEENKLVFLTAPGKHLKFDWDWFEENIVPFLKN